MGYTPKDWRNATTHEGGGDETTPISAVALEDLETRVTDYTDIHGAAVSVMDSEFGVVGDGITDDTAAFGDVRDGVGVRGEVYGPPEDYSINNVLLTTAQQHWSFANGAVVKNGGHATGNSCFEVRGTSVEIDGGEYDLQRTAGDTVGGGDAVVFRASHGRIRNAYIHDSTTYGVRAIVFAVGTSVDDLEVSSCVFEDNQAEAVIFNFTGATIPSRGWRIVNCLSDSTGVAGADRTGAGFAMVGPASGTAEQPVGCVISDCIVKAPTDGAVEDSGIRMTYVNGGAISGCTVEGCWEGFALPASTSCSISGCIASGFDNYGFEL